MSKNRIFNVQASLAFELRILKKHYCARCGNKFKRKFKIIEYWYTYRPFMIPFLPEKEDMRYILTPVYYCKYCDYYILYDEQKKIYQIQKKQEKKLLIMLKTL